MEVKVFKVEHGEESFLGELTTNAPIPKKGDILSFVNQDDMYKVLGVSYFYDVDDVLIEIMTKEINYDEEWYDQ